MEGRGGKAVEIVERVPETCLKRRAEPEHCEYTCSCFSSRAEEDGAAERRVPETMARVWRRRALSTKI